MGAVFEKKMVPFLFSAKGVQSMNQNTKPTERKGAGATSLHKRYGVSLPQDLSQFHPKVRLLRKDQVDGKVYFWMLSF